MDHKRQLYPNCILWSPLPPITWLLPFIGHTGIADSDGIIYDFAGPYSIGRGNMAFGAPTRYLKLDPRLITSIIDWNDAVSQGCDIYSQRMHNICFDNCHSHVAKCLNLMAYGGRKDYNMFSIGVWMFFSSSFVDFSGFLKTFGPFVILCLIIGFMCGYL